MLATKENAKNVAQKMRPYVDEYLLARCAAELERERVDKIQRRVLSEGQYTGRRPVSRGKDGIEYEQYRVTEPRDAYHMDDQSAEQYYARLNAIHVAEGFERAKDGYCPALVLEHEQSQAEKRLADAAAPMFGIDSDRLLCAGLEKYHEFTDLIVGLVVNSPGYTSPLERLQP